MNNNKSILAVLVLVGLFAVAGVTKLSKAFADQSSRFQTLNGYNIPVKYVRQNQLVSLEGEMTGESVGQTIKDLRAAALTTDKIYLLITSPGGSVPAGNMLTSYMRTSSVPIYTVCMEICASMAFTTLEYGVERYAIDRSVTMGHNSSMSGQVQGETPQILSFIKFLNDSYEKDMKFISKRSGMPLGELHQRYNKQMWLEAEDAKALGFLDDVIAIRPVEERK